jgi:hypothetical protein
MENPVDHTIDLGFVNYVQHPENKQYVVFRFADLERAATFKAELEEHKIWFEKDNEEKRGKNYTLFAIHNTDFKKAEKINYSVEGKHKKPIIPFRFLRVFLISLTAFVMTLTLMGYCQAQKKLEQSTQKTAE